MKFLKLSILLCISFPIFSQNQFKLTFSNIKNDVDVVVVYRVLKTDQTQVQIDSIQVPARGKMERIVRVRNNQFLEINPKSANRLFLRVTRTVDELRSTMQIEGQSPLNVNIIQLENLNNGSIDVAQLMEELNTNSILVKLLDTTEVILDKKIRLGSFLIYNEAEKKYLEVFEPTTMWYNRKDVEVFNESNDVVIKRTNKNSIMSAKFKVPKLLKLGGDRASSEYFDFRWKVTNFREEKFAVSNETPQTLFKKYPAHTGYDLLKDLVTNGGGSKYRVFFVSAWCLTDSISTFVDSYVGTKKTIEFNFDYPPNGTKVFGLDSKAAFVKANSEFRASVRKKIYNYFEVSDITASAMQQIRKDIADAEARKREEYRKAQIEVISNSIKETEEKIVSVYSALIKLDKRYIETNDITIILQVPFFKRPIETIADTLSHEIKAQVTMSNIESQTCNSFVEYIESKKIDLNSLKSTLTDLSLPARYVLLAMEKRIESTVEIKKLTGSELESLFQYSNR
jgi:hypothetical protein